MDVNHLAFRANVARIPGNNINDMEESSGALSQMVHLILQARQPENMRNEAFLPDNGDLGRTLRF